MTRGAHSCCQTCWASCAASFSSASGFWSSCMNEQQWLAGKICSELVLAELHSEEWH